MDFIEQPAARSETCLGETLTLSIIPLASAAPAIQWYKGSSPIAGATDRTLVLADISRAAAGTYTCELQDLCGNRVTSREAVVLVGGPPGITGQPQSVHVCPGETAETQFFFSSDYPATVQWFRVPTDTDGNASAVNGIAVAKADNNLLRFTQMNPGDNGFYRALVVNRCGTAWTQPIQVSAGVWLRATPRDSTNDVCNTLSLDLVASGKGPLQYRWRRNGEFMTNSARITNTAAATLRFAPLHYFDDATYDCVVSDTCNSLTSRVARIIVNPNPPFLLTDTNGPAGRTSHRMTYDSLRGRTVLFGGLADGSTITEVYRNDTWEYDGVRWTQRITTNSPSSRIDFSLAFDRHRGRVVLFGGATNNIFQGGLLNGETWEYDGTNWTQRFPVNSPAPRINAALFYDPVHRVTTLYGGDTTLANPRAGDLWTWDGTNWTQRVVTGARPLFGGLYGSPVRPQMIWDEARGYAVLPPTVSNDPGNPLRVTWLWDGTQWTAREHIFEGFGISPSQSGGGGGIAYDSFRREVVYWGGDGYDQTSLWRWNGSIWRHDEIDEFVGYHLDGASTYDDRRFALVQFGGSYFGSQPELRGNLPRTFERILADEPVFLRPLVLLNDPATNRLFFRITVAGAPPVTYEWQRNGVRISETFPYENTAQSTLAVDRILASDTGLYRCVVRNRCGEVISTGMTLAGVGGPQQTLRAFSAPVSGQPGLRLTWSDPASTLQEAPSLDGPWKPVPGATSPHEILPLPPQAFYRLNPGP